MDPLNLVMNKVDNWSQKKVDETGFKHWAKRNILTRATTVLVGVPLEIATVAQNALAVPFYTAGVVAKLAVKTVRIFSSAEFLRKADEALPTLGQLVKTILRVAAYAIGTIFTLVLGFISPSANFRLHCSIPYLNLAVNVRENAIKEQLLQQLAIDEQKRAEEEAEAEKILAAVAAMLQRAEEEAEANAAAQLQAARQAPVTTVTVSNTAEEVKVVQEKKPGFFRRLFGFGKPKTEAQVQVSVAA